MTHRLHRTALSICLALTAVAPAARAQSNELQPGARVRVTAPGIVANRYVGTVLARHGDTLELGGPNAAPVRIPIERIASAEVSRGSSRADGAKRGLVWGIPIGLLAGALSDASRKSIPSSCYGDAACEPDEPSTATQLLIGAAAGAAWGAGIGALVGRERWDHFDIGARSAFDRRDGRTRFGVAVRF
jgi:hypothetical protein